jgi:hypothetical protein
MADQNGRAIERIEKSVQVFSIIAQAGLPQAFGRFAAWPAARNFSANSSSDQGPTKAP